MRRLFFLLVRLSGIALFCREIIQRHKITILLYHDISEAVCREQFKYLKENYNIIDLNDYISAREGKRKLPKKSLIITFDDGHKRNFEMLPILEELEIPITIFLCSDIVNTNRHFWFLHKVQNITIEDLKRIPNQERLIELRKQGFEQNKEFKLPHALTKRQIEAMSNFVNFQSHTKYHPCLTNCSEFELFSEINGSKDILETEFGFNINSLAYPNGDFDERVINFTKLAGYSNSMTVDQGFNSLKSDPYRLKRLSTNDVEDFNEFVVRASGVYALILKIIIKFKLYF